MAGVYVLLLALYALHGVYGFECGKSTGKLQVHLVPHTHDDVGWLKTVDEYFYGANNSIQHAGVQYILDSVIPALQQNPSRTFIYVEIAFFIRWWNQQDQKMKATVADLVKRKQLEFINGGWCMNDEAATHYNAIIDQMTLGLRFINDTFGEDARPLVAWHIDPFGHSAEQASLFSLMSFDGFFFGRIDEEDKKKRLSEQGMEMVWRGSRNFEKASQIFTGVLYNGYNPPKGFCFDEFCNDQPIMDDPRLFDENVKERVNAFVSEVCDQAKHYKTNNIVLTMGSDFMYENANLWFKNLDKLIKYVNKDGRVNVLYSSPSKYLKALYDAGQTWTVKTDDFFPYAHCPHCYWTGYFTSRPALKGYIRKNNNLLQVCKQLETIHKPFDTYPKSETLKKAMAVNQHHDAVTGTEKQHVAYDYAKRLAIGENECQNLVAKVIGEKSNLQVTKTGIQNFTFCNYLNISVCPITEQSSSFVVNMYNGIGRPVSSYIRLPVYKKNMVVFGSKGQPLKSQIVSVNQATKTTRAGRGNAPYELIFNACAPGLGFSTYFVKESQAVNSNVFLPFFMPEVRLKDGTEFIENEKLRLDFSLTTGRLTKITRKDIKLSIDVDQQFFWYNASIGNDQSGQTSGAYIFRPNSSNPFNICKDNKPVVKVVKGPLVQEIRQSFGPVASQVFRLYMGEGHAEVEYTVGPIPVNDGLGKEIITRFDTNIKSNTLFYTDANGREIKERKRNYRATWDLKVTEPVSGNYYPINSRIFIKDSSAQLTILTDRSHGGSSIHDGSLEIMLHRRLLHDDFLGVNEALNEPGLDGKGLVVTGKQMILLTTPAEAPAQHRDLGEKMLLSPIISFAQNDKTISQWLKEYRPIYSALTQSLPPNVHLLTFESLTADKIILRLEHFYEKNEDPKLSKPVDIIITALFTDFEVSDMTELNLSANQLYSNKKMLNWKTTSDSYEKTKRSNQNLKVDSSWHVYLSPMQIRTFECDIWRK